MQFLVPSNEHNREAVAGSVPTTVEGVRTWVMLAEHLVAIALSTGRSNDHIRTLQFIEHNAVDRAMLQSILEHRGLALKWKQFEHDYLEALTSKKKMRKRLAALSFSEKIKVLEKLRDRSLSLAAGGLRRRAGSGGSKKAIEGNAE